MATLADALIARDEAAFLHGASALLSQALPSSAGPPASPGEGDRHSRGRLKSLPDLLADTGNPISCPFCAVPLARGPSARICLACGKALGPIPGSLDDKWESSCAHARFLQSLSLPEEKVIGGPGSGSSSARETSQQGPAVEAGAVAAEGSSAAAPGPMFEPESLLGGTMLPESTAPQPGGAVALFEAEPSSSSQARPSEEPALPSSQAGGVEDFFSQLSSLHSLSDGTKQSSAAPAEGLKRRGNGDPSPALKAILRRVPDLTFMLSDSLVLSSHRTARSNGVRGPAGKSVEDNMVRVLENMLQAEEEADMDEWGDFAS